MRVTLMSFVRVVDDVHHPPGTDPAAPLILVAFQLFASCGPRCMAQRLDVLDDTGQYAIR
jgi:hypothetical protein